MNRPARQPFSTLLRRALRLRCPLCGVSAIFLSLQRTRRFDDWFKPLDGCPRCGYAYDREPGYFLLATWVLNYGFVSSFGIAVWLFLEAQGGWTTKEILIAALVPMPIMSLLLVRHSKAVWLAIDHAFDPGSQPRPGSRDSRTPAGPRDDRAEEGSDLGEGPEP